tara:strand:- start:712 stop:1107 length:396 start_codon:yes stop_codon:yes gene_type:complete
MATIQFHFTNVNASLQVGDSVYYTSTINTPVEFTVGGSEIIPIGEVEAISSAPATDINGADITSGYLVTCDTGNDEDEIDIPSNAFIFFSKDNRANMASILGYYGEVEFKNNSVKKAELFAAACEMSESSK